MQVHAIITYRWYTLADIAKGKPKYAKYTSKDIQNEKIETPPKKKLHMKSNGTRDRCNVENLTIMIRFVYTSMSEDLLIGFA